MVHERLLKEEVKTVIEENILEDEADDFASSAEIADDKKDNLSNDLFIDELYVWKLLLYKTG